MVAVVVPSLTRARFIPVVYHFFVANLALFWIQGKRLFGFIGAGGTAGSLAGPAVTIGLSVPLGPTNLLIAAIIFLELAVLCVYQLERSGNAGQPSRPNEQRIGGSAFAAASELIYSPYLLGVAVWVSLLSFGATILYFQQAHIVAATVHDAGAQTRIFASIDLAVGLLTLATQVFATGWLLKRFGTGMAAGALPAVYVVGFAALAVVTSVTAVVIFQVAQRWMNFAIANPARQVFFTVVERLKLGGIALCALPVVAGWLVLSAALGRTQERRAALAP
jgi:ATP:ADP antiporter, AAA family